MSDVLLEDYEWLLSPAAEAPLARAAEMSATKKPLVQCVQSLRKEYSVARAHLLLETVELRQRGTEKFTHAGRMFFTRTGLEQATDEGIAAYKADRFPAGETTADWCCGIGGDLTALAQRGAWCGVDRDPVMRLLAAHNVAVANGLEDVRQQLRPEIDIAQVPPEGCWHLDPDRRASGSRAVRMESFSPSLEFIQDVLHARPNGALKIAPASEVPDEWSHAQREWISRGGECRQQVVWFGKLAQHPGEHVATIVSPRAEPCSIHGHPTTDVPIATAIGSYLHEPDAAVLAAKLTGVLAEQLKLTAIAAGSVYLTSDTAANHPAFATFAIRDQLPFDLKKLKAYFRERGIGKLEIKKRGVDVQPEQLRKSLSLAGDESATLFVTRLGKKVVAFVANRC